MGESGFDGRIVEGKRLSDQNGADGYDGQG